MRLASFEFKDKRLFGIVSEYGIIPIDKINYLSNKNFSIDLFSLILNNEVNDLKNDYDQKNNNIIKENSIPFDKIKYLPLYKTPQKILCIGLNYVEHAKDLSEKNPTEIPASFFKVNTTIIGDNDTILLPKLSEKVTGEAELGIIIGKECKNIEIENWLDYIAGFTSIIDMTAEDILRKNPRYLTVSKNFDTFFSFGPHLITPDEIKDLNNIEVSTYKNNLLIAKNTISNMTFPPDFLVSFHSKVMTLLPGDIISTGTPKAVQLNHGDVVECRISNFIPLQNRVIDLKISN